MKIKEANQRMRMLDFLPTFALQTSKLKQQDFMDSEQQLFERSQSTCELCTSTEDLRGYAVPPFSEDSEADKCVLLCANCEEQVKDPETIDKNHLRCLTESMWSVVPAVQVLSWRMLNLLENEPWAQDAITQMYMDEETAAWAQEGADAAVVHKDSNGHVLKNGDSVVLIKDLNVKGANFVAKRGTAVRRISLVHDNPEHIEGRVNDQHIVILTKFVKKT